MTPANLATAYSMAANQGTGVTVGIYELEPYSTSDISAFQNCYGIASGPPTAVSVDGAPPNLNAGGGEAALDIELVNGLAPKAQIKVYVGHNGGVDPLDVYSAMVNDTSPAQVLTTSWGQCEPDAGAAVVHAEALFLQQAAAQGQSFLAAAGDEGSEDCNFPGFSADTTLQVDDPASQPWMTSVGGTELEALGPPTTEPAWNTGVIEGTGGGGISTLWTMPSWQLGPGVQTGFTKPNDSFSGATPCPVLAAGGTVSCREVPDVAADADPNTGFAVFWSGSWQTIGGTSMGAPLWAALVAIADQSAPSKKVGLLNPALYQAGCLTPRPFNDVTSGNNQPIGSPASNPPHQPGPPYYPAGTGYDLATGLGTPIASSLIPDLITPANACPVVSSMSAGSGPPGGGTVVTLSGTNLGSTSSVDFGPGNAATLLSVSGSSVTVATPASPTGGWNTAMVVLNTPSDSVGYDGRNYFTYTGPRGYWTTASDGGVFTFGGVGYYGSMGGVRLQRPVVGIAPTASSKGYWLVASDGGLFAFGDAGFHGSMGGTHINKPVVGMAATPDGRGYWLVASDGGIFAFGDAAFYGSTGNQFLNAPIVGMAVTPDGGGYWLVASDGGIFAFGDARFFGSMGGMRLNKPVVGMATTPDGNGYLLVASDGGIFAFGDAAFAGSTGGHPLNKPVVGIAAPFGGRGYWLVASDGGIFAFGSAGFAGSMGGQHLNASMVGMGGT